MAKMLPMIKMLTIGDGNSSGGQLWRMDSRFRGNDRMGEDVIN
jgi:hypothetical protein